MAASPSKNILDQLLVTFAVEAQEHLEAMNRHLLALEQGVTAERRRPLVAELFREAHSLKGAARTVCLTEVEGLAHTLEDFFDHMKAGDKEPGPQELQEAYTTVDAIAAALRPDDLAATEAPAEAQAPEETAGTSGTSGTAGTLGAPGTEAPGTLPASAGSAPTEPGKPTGPVRPIEPTKPTIPGRDVPVVVAEPTSALEETVRIRTSKLDALMADVGELLAIRIAVERRLTEIRALEASLANLGPSPVRARGDGRGRDGHERAAPPSSLAQDQGRLDAARRDLSHLRRMLDADARRLAHVTSDLQDDVRRTRMLPVGTVFGAFPRMVRDLARDQGKEVSLSLAGSEIEVDRSVLEQVKDPLMHLLRNCVAHGIEPPAARAEAGKPAAGAISVSARQRGDSLLMEVSDDGGGIDVALVRSRAVSMGLLSPADAGDLSEREAVALIFRAGLSSSPGITGVAGRGVGLDVVRETVDRLHGSIEVTSRRGAGTTFSLSLPLSVSTMLCLLIETAGQTFALAASSIERIVRVGHDEIEWAGGRQTARVGGRPVALAELSEILGAGETEDTTGSRDAGAGRRDPAARRPVVVVGTAERRAAFLVDHVTGTHELVVKSLPAPLLRVRYVTGATVLGSGEVAMILSAPELVGALEHAGPSPTATKASAAEQPTILVVEDSVTTRTLEKNILEAAGFRVRVAADGAEGWDRLQSGSYDLVLTDIEMPRMDGFELVGRIRADQRHRQLPVVLVTSRDSREDRERSIQMGADAYVVKGGFDQDRLLETIRRLI